MNHGIFRLVVVFLLAPMAFSADTDTDVRAKCTQLEDQILIERQWRVKIAMALWINNQDVKAYRDFLEICQRDLLQLGNIMQKNELSETDAIITALEDSLIKQAEAKRGAETGDANAGRRPESEPEPEAERKPKPDR